MNKEQQTDGPENLKDQGHSPESLRPELKSDRLKYDDTEKNSEKQQYRADNARETIAQQESIQNTDEAEPTAKASKPSYSIRLDLAINYTQTLQGLQRRLSPASKVVSRVIHNPAIEVASEALEKTVMRPSIINGALWSAAFIGAAFYIVARKYGYQLSGSEMLISLVGGAAIGIVLEYAVRILTKHKR